MKITFFSNYLNHLLAPFCDQLYKYLGDDFKFISTEKLPTERLDSGYKDCSHYPYNINSFQSDDYYNLALQLGMNSEIVIIGSAPEIFIKKRLLINKLTFRYSERLLKQGAWRLLDPRLLLFHIRRHTIYRKRRLYMLCTSAYTSNDLSLIFAYPKKQFKWGYFTEVKELNINQIIAQKPLDRIEIIWTARFIEWKHPELAVKLAYELKRKGYNFHLKMIGTGELFEDIQILIKELNVSDCVFLLGSMSNEDVRSYMQKSNIFIFTSDRNEGWGVVLNEAMSCGCAVVASNMIGAVPYLVENNQNGLIFKSGSLSSLLKQTENLITNKELREKISKNAYYTLSNIWSPEQAAFRFLKLSEKILGGQDYAFESGPCSLAMNTKIYKP